MPKEIPLPHGFVALVDDEDYEWLMRWKWHQSDGYAVRSVYSNGKRAKVHMHREVLGITAAPATVMSDHVNHDRLDNRRSNLRIADDKGNQGNRKAEGGTSRFKGVYRHKNRKKWWASIGRNGKTYHLGVFLTEEEAAHAYDKAAKEHFGEFANLNFPRLGERGLT